MSKDLEQFISSNRKAFDDKMPSSTVWDNLAAEITGKRKKTVQLSTVIKCSLAVAAVLLIALFVYFGFTKAVKPAQDSVSETVALVPGSPEVNEFARLILMKQDELKKIASGHPLLYQKFTKDIIQLDSTYNSLKNQLSVNPNKEILLKAMIQNLELQLSVLNQQLNIINQIKQSKKYSHEKKFPST